MRQASLPLRLAEQRPAVVTRPQFLLVRSERLVERRAGSRNAWRSSILGVADEFSAPLAQEDQ